jgi:transposase
MIPATALPRQVRRQLAVPIRQAAQVPEVDRYCKHFTAEAHLWLLPWHGCAPSPSLRQTHAQAATDPAFWTGLGRYRRLSKDYEALPTTEEAWIYLGMIRLMVARLAP